MFYELKVLKRIKLMIILLISTNSFLFENEDNSTKIFGKNDGISYGYALKKKLKFKFKSFKLL